MKRKGLGFGILRFRPEGIKVDMLTRQLEIMRVKLKWWLERWIK